MKFLSWLDSLRQKTRLTVKTNFLRLWICVSSCCFSFFLLISFVPYMSRLHVMYTTTYIYDHDWLSYIMDICNGITEGCGREVRAKQLSRDSSLGAISLSPLCRENSRLPPKWELIYSQQYVHTHILYSYVFKAELKAWERKRETRHLSFSITNIQYSVCAIFANARKSLRAVRANIASVHVLTTDAITDDAFVWWKWKKVLPHLSVFICTQTNSVWLILVVYVCVSDQYT